MLSFNRSLLEVNTSIAPEARESLWADHRPELLQHGVDLWGSAIEDVRLLSHGTVLIGALCGGFTKVVWLAMVARHGYMVKALAVDACHAGLHWLGLQRDPQDGWTREARIETPVPIASCRAPLHADDANNNLQ